MQPARVPPTKEQLLTIEDLMKVLRVSKRTIHRYLAAGTLPQPIRFSSSCLRWRASTIDKYLAKLAPSATPGKPAACNGFHPHARG